MSDCLIIREKIYIYIMNKFRVYVILIPHIHKCCNAFHHTNKYSTQINKNRLSVEIKIESNSIVKKEKVLSLKSHHNLLSAVSLKKKKKLSETMFLKINVYPQNLFHFIR